MSILYLGRGMLLFQQTIIKIKIVNLCLKKNLIFVFVLTLHSQLCELQNECLVTSLKNKKK